MVKTKGRRVALAAGAMGIATIALAAFLGRDRIAEEWWLWRFSRGLGIEEKTRAIERLGELRSSRAVPLMVSWVRRETEARRNLVMAVVGPVLVAIQRIGSAAVPSILPILDDPDRDMRIIACLSLSKLGPQAAEALPALIQRTKDHGFKQRGMAVQALGKIGPPSTVLPTLVGILDENDSLARNAAIHAIGDMGPAASSALPKLKDLSISREVQEAIDKIEGRKPAHPETIQLMFEAE